MPKTIEHVGVEAPLRMVSLSAHPQRMAELARRRQLPPHAMDPGYLTHCLLGELFGEQAPRLFSVEIEKSGFWRVLAYGHVPGDALREHADAFAPPELHSAVDWAGFADKGMPAAWREGLRLGFACRACPVVRRASDGPHQAAGAEVDAFLARCSQVGLDVLVDREAVYREWVTAQIERLGGAKVLGVRVVSYERARLFRRTQGEVRKASHLERPNVRFEGELEITDSVAFSRLLARGVGRHRAFGFGMLLLRPSSASC